jgi:hypothetical protein
VDPTTFAVIDSAEVERRFAVAPRLLPDVLSLIGDPGRGIPGVPGVGIKTAANLVTDYGGAEGVLEAAASMALRPPSRRDALTAHADAVRRALATAKIPPLLAGAGEDDDASASETRPHHHPVAARVREAPPPRPDYAALISRLEDLEMSNLIAQVAQDEDPSLEHERVDMATDGDYELIGLWGRPVFFFNFFFFTSSFSKTKLISLKLHFF